MAITINGNGTITGISTGGLPDGIVDTDMLAAGAATQAKRTYATGEIVQVKQARLTSGSFTTSSTSFVDITGLSVDITPTSSSSKILVLVQGGEWGHYTGGAYTSYMKILRDSTAITGDNKVNAREGSGNAVGNASFSILDSPNTTSAVTYKGQARTDDSSKTVYVQNGDNGNISITVMEVAA